MRSLIPMLLALPAGGCVGYERTPASTDRVEVLDEAGAPLPEAWAVSWSETRSCPLGLLCWYPFGTLTLCPEWKGKTDVRLRRLTPGSLDVPRPAGVEAWVQWGLLLLPPGSYYRSFPRLQIFAAGCPWGFDGDHWRSPEGRILARARSKPDGARVSDHPDFIRAGWIAHVFEASDIPREDLRDFARMLLGNLEQLGVQETAPPDVVRKLHVLIK